MSERFFATQHLVLEVETGDATLPAHSDRFIWYIPPAADGTPGDVANKASVSATAVTGANGFSVNQGARILLTPGVLRFWSESNNASGDHCVSPAFDVLVEKLGTVRRG